jgi:aspartyl-tRNA(Asn)/glutamyl-tRNA(Gln) amidotransferase subunit A
MEALDLGARDQAPAPVTTAAGRPAPRRGRHGRAVDRGPLRALSSAHTMPTREVAYTSAADLAEMIRTRKLSPVEVVDTLIARIEASQPVLNAFMTIAAEGALEAARAAEAQVMRGDTLGPLHGVPFTVKDLLATAGVRTTYCSWIFEKNVPADDVAAVARMKAAGAIMAGKVTSPEFGHKPMNEAPIFGRTANPWNLGRTPGGSSGGSGAALAAGLGPLSIGTDAGGSIRIPAACTGTVGMKATLGLVPNEVAPDGFGNFSNTGPMARTVLDAALMLDAMAGAHPGDPHSLGLVRGEYAAAARAGGDLRGCRIACFARLGNQTVDAEVMAALEAAAGAFRDLGATVEPVEETFANTEPYWLVISQSLWVARFAHYLPEWESRMTPTLVRGIKEGQTYRAAELQRATMFRSELFRRVQGWFGRFDLVLTPTISRTALPIDHDFYAPIEIEGRPAGSVRTAWYPYTHPFNMTGHPALSVPCGWARDGLPMALQIVGPMMGDATVLRAGALFEAARPWAHRRPQVPGLD